MGKLETLPNGRHIIRGGFSTAKKEDKELVKPLLEKNLDKTIKKNWKGVSMGERKRVDKKIKAKKSTKKRKAKKSNK